MTQASRLEIIVDSSKAKREVDNLDKALINIETHGDKASKSVQNVGNEANAATGKFSALKKQLIDTLGNSRFGGMINDVNSKLATLNGTTGIVTAGLAGMAVGGIATATSALALMAIQSAKADAQLAVLAKRANVNTTSFQVLEHAALQLGMSQDGLAQSLADAQEKLGEFTASGGSGEAADFFDALKNNTKMTDEEIKKFAKTLQGKDGVEVLQIMKDKLDELGASAQEQRFVFESLGNDLGNLLPVFANGGVLLDEFGAALEDAGVIKSKEAIAQAKILAAQTQAVNLQFQGAKNELVQGFTPSLTSLAEAMFASSENGVTLKDVGAGLGTVFKTVGTIALGVAASVKVLGNGLGGLAAITERLIARDFSGAKAIFNELDSNSAAAFDDLFMRADKIWNVTNASTSSTSKLTNALLGLNSATEQNNQNLKVNAKDAKIAEKAALDAAKARKQLADATERLNAQQEKSRSSIDYAFSIKSVQNQLDLAKQISDIQKAGFSPSDEARYIELAKNRYKTERDLFDAQMVYQLNEHKWTDEQILNAKLEIAKRELRARTDIEDSIKKKFYQAEIEKHQIAVSLLEITRAKRMLDARQFYMTEIELIKERYKVERDEIEATINDRIVRQKRLDLSRSEEQSILLTRAAQANRNWGSSYAEMTGNSQMFQLDQTRQDRTGQSLALVDAQKALAQTAEQREAIWQAHMDRMALIESEYQASSLRLNLSYGEQITGSMSEMFKVMFGEQSRAYTAMFALEKGFAVAQAAVSLANNISKASEIGFPYNLPMIAGAIRQGAQILSILGSANFTPQGFANGGQIRGPGTTTSDSIPIMASDKEFMFKASSAASIGLENLNYMNRTGELPPNHDAAQLSAIQRQQRQSDLINTSINQRNAAPTQSAAPTVVDNNMKVVILDDRSAVEQELMGPSGEKAFLYHWKRNQSKLRS